MKIILLANYPLDQNESMDRYVALLERLLRQASEDVEVIRPPAFFGRLKPSAHGLGKWLGYLDKFVLFHWHLGRLLRHQRVQGKKIVVHICDHSNSMYVPWIHVPVLVTCHDLLAVKSALGLVPQNRTGWSGRILQRWILRGLKRASFVACDSTASRDDLLSLAPHLHDQCEVIDLPLSYPFTPLTEPEIISQLRSLVDGQPLDADGKVIPYLFHIGGNQWYKNREGVLRIFAQLKRSGSSPHLKLVMAGKAPTPGMLAFVREQALQDDVLFPSTVSDLQLNALYSGARALLYPSLQEGYGWPLLEAQASGCLVVTSNLAPLNQVGGPAAFYADPHDETTFVAKLVECLNLGAENLPSRRRQAQGHASAYSSDRFLKKMQEIYADLAGRGSIL